MLTNKRLIFVKKILKDRVENEKGPLGCYIIWNSVLERLG